ncbi:MAG: 3'(2'),5'-bisphosphate nucleotidase CysQ [Alphaproteobacteria bacterium]
MTSPSPVSEAACADLALIKEAVLACGPLLRDAFGGDVQIWSKPGGSPVTEIDLAVNEILHGRLTSARPDYGWLSEESPDDKTRLSCTRTFIVDPLDGTTSFIKGRPEFGVAVALAYAGVAVAGIVYNPITEELFEASLGDGARLNGAPMKTSAATSLEQARILTPKTFFSSRKWAAPWPEMQIDQRGALTYRMALVACGAFDGTASLGLKHEWDIAAGAILISEAGGRITDPWDEPLTFNQPDPRVPGMVAAGACLHPLLIERLRETPHPRAEGKA